jgi:ethanolamine utilization protein EutN
VLIARVIGELVSTQKHPSHHGRKALLVQPLHLDGSNRGDAVVALDSVDAGVGDRVLLVTEGYSAMTSVGRPESPIDMAVIGVIDSIELNGVGLGSPLIDNPVSARSGPADAALPLPLETDGGLGKELLLPAVPVKNKPGRKKDSSH